MSAHSITRANLNKSKKVLTFTKRQILSVSSNSPKKMNKRIRFYQYDEFVSSFLGEFEDIKMSFRNYLTFTNASRYIPNRPRICINRNPPFQTSFNKIFKNFFLLDKSNSKVNRVLQCLHLVVLLLSKLGSKRRDFNGCRFWACLVCTLMLCQQKSRLFYFYLG